MDCYQLGLQNKSHMRPD